MTDPMRARFHELVAELMVDACNAEERDLNAATFARYTRPLALEDADAVLACLPWWAQRRIAETTQQDAAA